MSDAYIYHQKVITIDGQLRREGDARRYGLAVNGHNADEKVRDALYQLGPYAFVWAEDDEGRWLYGMYQPSNAWQLHRNGKVEVHLVRPEVLRYKATLTDDDTQVSFLAFVERLQGMHASQIGVLDVTSSTPLRILRFCAHQDTYLSFSFREDPRRGVGPQSEAHLITPLDKFYVSADGKSLKIDQRRTYHDPDAIREYRAFELQFVTKETIGPAVIDPAGIRAARDFRRGEMIALAGIPAPQELRVGEEVLDLNHGRVNPAALRELDIRAPACTIYVNGLARAFKGGTVATYEQILKLADMRPGASMTYEGGPESNREGTLYVGKLIDVQEGMTFCVAYTDNA